MTALPMSPEKLAEALRGDDAQAVLASLLRADPRRDVLRACALVLAFDEALYSVLAPRGAPPFSELVTWSEVEPMVGRDGWYRVVRRQEKAAWWWEPEDDWNRVPQLLAQLARRAAAHVEERGDEQELLHLLLYFDERRARSLLRRLYDAADARFDLAACHELLGLVAEALPFATHTLTEQWQKLRAYLEARTRFSDDFHRSRLYLRRDALDEKFDVLFLRKTRKWILNLHATGGMGKTAAIQWLIAHRCVTPAYRIPVARFNLDFDDIFELTEGRRLVLKLVAQLAPQLPGNAFGSLLDELQTTAADEAPRMFNMAVEAYEEEVTARFARNVVEAIGGAPVLIVIDTIENALLHRNELAKVVALLAAIRGAAKGIGIRLLLAGRYPLKEVAESTAFEKDCDEVFVDPMSPDEAQRYLVEKRKLDDEDIVALVVKRSGGIPLKLSLYADIIRTTPGLTAADIEEYGRKGADVIYLIERVVDRLKHEPMLQWVLRYGAVPRQLTLPFIQNVMAPYLRRAMATEWRADAPTKNIPDRFRKTAFPRNLLASPEMAVDFAQLWTDLRKYASEHSWVYPDPDPARKDALIFRGDVVNPMRRLLSENPVFVTLHRAAVRYYEREARKQRGAAWAALTCEAIYHRYQIGQNGKAAWRAAVEKARRAGDPEVIRTVAREITRSEYVDEAQPLVPPTLIAEAHGIEAMVLVRMARGGQDEAWSTAGVSVSKGEAALRGRKTTNASLLLAKAADLAQKGSSGRAKEILARKLRGPAELSRLLLLAEIVSNAYDSRVAGRGPGQYRRAAHAAARRLGFFRSGRPPDILLDRDAMSVETIIVFGLASNEFMAGHAGRAMALVEELLVLMRGRRATMEMEAFTAILADYRLRCMEPAASHPVMLGPAAETLRQQYRLPEALEMLDRELESYADLPENVPARRAYAAYLFETRMRVRADLMDMEGARADGQQAIEYARRVREPGALVRMLRESVRVELQFGKDVRSARVRDLVGQLERAAKNAPRGDAIAAWLIVLAHSHAVHLPLPWLMPQLRGKARERLERVTVAAAGLAWTGNRRKWARRLLRDLRQVQPLGLRLAVLEPLRSVHQVDISLAARRALRNAISTGFSDDLHPLDRALQTFRRAEILLALGFTDEAQRDLAAVRRHRALFQRPAFVGAFNAVARRADPMRVSTVQAASAQAETPTLLADVDIRVDSRAMAVRVKFEQLSKTLTRKDPWTHLGIRPKRRGAVVPHEFVAKFLSDASTVRRRMRDYLFAQMPIHTVPRDLDISLQIDDVLWHALPWELAFDLPAKGRRTLFRTAPLEHSLPQTIEIAHSLVTWDVVMPPRLYPKGTVIHASQLRSALSSASPQIVHIISGFAEATDSATVYLKLEGGPKDVSANVLASMISSNPRLRKAPPVVVVDVLTTSGPSEGVRQAMLRNIFAAQLFHTGAVAAVLATALVPGTSQYGDFIGDLRHGSRLIDLLRRKRRRAAYTTAIFAPSPSLTLRLL